jgi:ABC-type dipeptide/oligopeptide/nickel transport system permease component
MLKKIVNSILVVFLLVTTSGFTLTRHFCGDQLVSVALGKDTKSCCEKTASNCCHQETKHFQFKENFLSSVTELNLEDSVIKIMISFSEMITENLFVSGELKKFTDYSDSSPPRDLLAILSFLQIYRL